jgi:CRP-like cAMP-binding protein
MATTIEKVLALQDLEIFAFASTEHLAQLAALCEQTEVASGKVLFERGHTSVRVYFLVEGRVSMLHEHKNTTVEKCALDFWSVLGQSEHAATAQAVDTCFLLSTLLDDFVDLMTAEPEFCLAILKQVARLGRSLQN